MPSYMSYTLQRVRARKMPPRASASGTSNIREAQTPKRVTGQETPLETTLGKNGCNKHVCKMTPLTTRQQQLPSTSPPSKLLQKILLPFPLGGRGHALGSRAQSAEVGQPVFRERGTATFFRLAVRPAVRPVQRV